MKKILIATGIATLAFVAVASAQGYSFQNNLTVGSTGADVSALQTALMSMGYNIPAIASGAASKGYFGSQTKAAVTAYQQSKGLPATGFFGPLTRNAINGGAVSVSNNCLAGWTTVTYGGQSFCVPVGFAGSTGSTGTVTGNGGTGTISTPGAEGLITTKLAASPISDANIRSANNVPVYGIEVKAQGSDMIVDRVLLQMQVSVGSVGSGVSNPATFIRTVYAYDGSTLLKSWSVGANDFNLDSSDRYYFIATGLHFLVPKDTSKVLTFAVDVVGVSSDQSSRIIVVQGYAGNTQNVRAIDGAGLNSYADMSGSSNSRTQTFSTSGSSTLTSTTNSALTPKASTNRLSTTDGAKNVLMQVIDVKSETGDSIIKKVNVYVRATSTAGLPSTLYLYDGSTMLSSLSVPSDTNDDVNFTTLNILVPKDTTKQLTIKADFPTTAGGQAASTSVPANGIQWQKPDSTTASTSPSGALTSADQYLYSAGPQWALVSASSVAQAGVKDVSSSSVSGTIVLRATAFGGSMTLPVAGDFSVVFASSTQTTYSTANSVTGGNKVVTVSPTDSTVGDGGTYTVTITDTVYSNDSEIGSSQPVFMAIKDIDSVVGGNTITNQTWGINTFYTPAQQLTRGTF